MRRASASAAPSSAAPALQVKEARHDFGRAVQGDVLQHSFELANTGAARIELEDVTQALGCSGLLEPSALDPGQAGRLAVTCHVEIYGPLRVTLALRSKIDAATLAEVELSGNVTPLLAFEPPLLSVRLPFGAERALDVALQGALAGQATLTLSDAGDAGISALSLPTAGDESPRLRLRVRGRKVGVHVGNIVLGTNLERPRQLNLPYSCEVLGNLDVTPSTPYFDLRAPGGTVREIAVRSSQPDFALKAVRVVDGPFSASLGPRAANGEYRVAVTVHGDRISGDARGTLGRLVLLSNDRAEPNKELSLFAFGAPNPDAPR